jgi:hypothetical protein
VQGFFCRNPATLISQLPTKKSSQSVLKKFSELASTRGDEKTARKGGVQQPLSAAETQRIEAAIKAIIRRVGEIDGNPSLPELTMSDLPPLVPLS